MKMTMQRLTNICELTNPSTYIDLSRYELLCSANEMKSLVMIFIKCAINTISKSIVNANITS